MTTQLSRQSDTVSSAAGMCLRKSEPLVFIKGNAKCYISNERAFLSH